MSTINDQNQVPSVNQSDLIPVYSNTYGVTQQMSVSQLSAYILSLIGGSNGLVTQYASPNATGFSVSLESVPNLWLVMTPLAGYAAGTIVLPSLPVNQQQICISTTQAVTTLTVNGNGKTVNGAPTTLAANATFSLRYDGVNQSWYRI